VPATARVAGVGDIDLAGQQPRRWPAPGHQTSPDAARTRPDLTDYVERLQSPEILDLLADQIDTHVPSARPTAVLLRRQADFIAAGGAAPDSPMAAMTSRGALNAAMAGGIGGLSG
jgi:hypothetical protein